MNQIFKFTCLAILSCWVWGTFVQHADGAIHILLGVGLYGSLLCLLSERAADARAQRRLSTAPLLLASSNTGRSILQKNRAHAAVSQPHPAVVQMDHGDERTIRPPHSALASSDLKPQSLALILRSPAPILVAEIEEVSPQAAPILSVAAAKIPEHAGKYGAWITIVQPDESEEIEEGKTLRAEADHIYFKNWERMLHPFKSFPWKKIGLIAESSNRALKLQKWDADILTKIKRRTQDILQEMHHIQEEQCAISQRILAVRLHTFRSQRPSRH
jgi:hypothetical protein